MCLFSCHMEAILCFDVNFSLELWFLGLMLSLTLVNVPKFLKY